tara:strand:- start:263 stop:1354 length:1092 start_codon:yes stop_codon:yes gene_type:complete
MPFKSEAQRRYLWANEPEIARDWTDTYGSRIQKANGGIMSMQGGVKNYLGEQPMINAPKYWQSAPNHEMTELAYITPKERDVLVNMNMYGTMDGSPNEGPSGIMSLNGWGDKEQGFGMSDTGQGISGTGGHGYGDQERYTSTDVTGPENIHGGTTKTIGPTTPKDHFTQRHTGSGWLGGGNKYGYSDVYMSGPKQGQTKPGLGGRILGGLGSMITGIPFVGGALGTMYDYGKGIFGPKTKDMSQYSNLGLYDDRMKQKAFYDDALYSDNYSDMTLPGFTNVKEEFDVKDLITKISDNSAMDEYWKKALGDNQYKHANWFTDLFKKDPEDIQLGQEGSLLDETKDILQKNREEAEKTKERFKDI